MNITGNTIFIPGATSGIGLALALHLEARGNTLIVGGRRADLLAKITAEPLLRRMGLLHDRVTGWVTQPEWLAWS